MRRRGVFGAALGLLLMVGSPASAQEVSLSDFAWLAGSWRGPGPDGASTAEIHFMPPTAGVLPSIFRLYQGDQVLVLEAISLKPEEDGLYMYVRHFDTALLPLEKDHAIRLRLSRTDGDTFVFENVRAGENPRVSVMTRTDQGFTAWSELVGASGGADTIRVEYRRIDGH